MRQHANCLKPRFASVLKHLEEAFNENDLGSWESADGGYFISFDTRPGLAKTVVRLAGEAGVKLTPLAPPTLRPRPAGFQYSYCSECTHRAASG